MGFDLPQAMCREECIWLVKLIGYGKSQDSATKVQSRDPHRTRIWKQEAN